MVSLVLLLISILNLAACMPGLGTPVYAPFVYADLRLLDPIDAPEPTHDLIALYARSRADDLQMRLDLLDHAPLPDYDLYIALDSAPGGATQLPFGQDAAIGFKQEGG